VPIAIRFCYLVRVKQRYHPTFLLARVSAAFGISPDSQISDRLFG